MVDLSKILIISIEYIQREMRCFGGVKAISMQSVKSRFTQFDS